MKTELIKLRYPQDRWHFWSMVSHKAFQSALLLHQRCFSEALTHSEAEDSFTGVEFFFYKMHPQHLQVIPTSGTSPEFGILSQISAGLCLLAGDPPWEYFFKNQVEERSKAAESTSELLPPLAFLCKAIKHLYNATKPPCLLEQRCPAL